MTQDSARPEGLVVASHGRHCVVEAPDGSRRICHPRGKKSQAVVGDHVRWIMPAAGQGDEGTIEKVLPRRNLFYRQDEIRTKSFAAYRMLQNNLDAEVAERPEELVVYGGIGRAARNWECYDQILAALRGAFSCVVNTPTGLPDCTSRVWSASSARSAARIWS